MSVMNSCANSSIGSRGRPHEKGPVCPAGITTIMGTAFCFAIRLSRMNPARPTDDQD